MKFLAIPLLFNLALLATDPPPPPPTPPSGTNVTSDNKANSTAAIQQNFGGGTQIQAPQPYQAQTQAYLGPWSTGANILDDLRALPETLTYEQAKRMYNGDVNTRINRMQDGSLQFRTVKFLSQFPSKVIQAQDGKFYLVPDESRFERVAFIWAQGKDGSTTLDVLAKGALEAMNCGGNAIMVLKKQASNETATSGWGIGFGSATGAIHGDNNTRSSAGSAGTGYNSAKARPVYAEGLMLLVLKTDGKGDPMIPTPAPEPPKAQETPKATPVPQETQVILAKTVQNPRIDTQDVHFELNSAILTHEAKIVIEKLVSQKADKYVIGGFTSRDGSDAFNQALSQSRANSVRDYMIRLGIPKEKVIINQGKTRPTLKDNRRTEILSVTLE